MVGTCILQLMAIAKVKATGGLQKSNPNKVGAAAKKDVTQEKIKKRVAENLNSKCFNVHTVYHVNIASV